MLTETNFFIWYKKKVKEILCKRNLLNFVCEQLYDIKDYFNLTFFFYNFFSSRTLYLTLKVPTKAIELSTNITSCLENVLYYILFIFYDLDYFYKYYTKYKISRVSVIGSS